MTPAPRTARTTGGGGGGTRSTRGSEHHPAPPDLTEHPGPGQARGKDAPCGRRGPGRASPPGASGLLSGRARGGSHATQGLPAGPEPRAPLPPRSRALPGDPGHHGHAPRLPAGPSPPRGLSDTRPRFRVRPSDTRPRFPVPQQGSPGAPVSGRSFPRGRPGGGLPRPSRTAALPRPTRRPNSAPTYLTRPRPVRCCSPSADDCLVRAPHTHHPGLRRFTHVSPRPLKAPRPAASAAEDGNGRVALRGGAGLGPAP